MISVLVMLAVQAAPQDGAWKNLYKKDGITLDSRTKPTKGSPFFEYRATTDTDLDVETLCREVFEWSTTSKDHDDITARKILEDKPDLRVVYDELTPPVVAKRDYAFTATRTRNGDKGCRIEMVVTNDKAPELPAKWVRINKLKSTWIFDSTDKGAHVTYTLFSDPGGDVPPMMVHHAQQDATWKTVKSALQYAHAPRAEAAKP